jgi:predicted RNase H-like HicB family nuclease
MPQIDISLEQLYQLIDQLPLEQVEELRSYLAQKLFPSEHVDFTKGEKQVRETSSDYKTELGQIKTYIFPVVIEYDAEDNVYLADCPALQGCYTDGETYEEALDNIRDAIKLHVEERIESGEMIPTPQLVQVAI